MIPYGRQNIDKSDIAAVVKVLKSDFITQGPTTPQFEKAISKVTKSKYACAVNSATSALHIACLALDIGKGDIVWTSPISFVASSNCALHCGAIIDFVDIDKTSYNICVNKLSQKLINAEKEGKLPKAVIAVHLSGQSCDMKTIKKLSKKYNFKIIEDAAHAIGGKYQGEPIGNCNFSDITVFSFHPVKIITTCEGGICTTNDPDLYNRLCRYRSHGITRQPKEMLNKPDGSWYYEQLDLGFNFRLNDLMSALGLSQLNKLDKFISEREKIAQLYNALFEKTSIITPKQSIDSISSRHLYIIRVPKKRNIVFDNLRNNGIGVNIHYIPIYRQPFYKKYKFKYQDFTEAENYYKEAISIPIYPGLSESQQEKIVKIIQDPPGYQNIF